MGRAYIYIYIYIRLVVCALLAFFGIFGMYIYILDILIVCVASVILCVMVPVRHAPLLPKLRKNMYYPTCVKMTASSLCKVTLFLSVAGQTWQDFKLVRVNCQYVLVR